MSYRAHSPRFAHIRNRLRQVETVEQRGTVVEVRGLIIEAEGPNLGIGDLCRIRTPCGEGILAEAVGFRDQRMLLMPLEPMHKITPGCDVTAETLTAGVPVGEGLLGRIMDGLGRPIDGGAGFETGDDFDIRSRPPNPMTRRHITDTFSTGVRAVDLFIPLGGGQRMGIFAGSGVGKSTLMGMLTRGSAADVNVIALIGERGRELREFIDKDLGPEGLARSIIVVATSDEPALVRLRAACLATTIAENFREAGKNVLFLMDSVTRFAMAQREIGLAVGEPPATRGYPPSVFSLLPRLLERTGNSERGSITALYTVLVEGDDMNEPIADAVRGILDGHLVLSRALATANQFPAVDVLESVSRLSTAVCSKKELALIAEARDLLALYRKNEDLITIGAYVPKSNPRIDRAIAKREKIMAFLRQDHREISTRTEDFARLEEILR